MPGLRQFPMYMNRDAYGLADKLAVKLVERGVEAIVTDEIPPSARHVIYLGVTGEPHGADQAQQMNHAAFAAARNIAQTMEDHGGIFWTVQSTGGDFGLSGKLGNGVGSAGLAALAKTAVKEWPKTVVKAIDVDIESSLENIANQICDELFLGGLEKEVGFLANGTRVAIGLALSHQKQTNENRLVPYDTLLVSGGARGVTADSLVALAEKQPLRFILLGRSSLSETKEETSEVHSEQELTKLLFEHATAKGEVVTPMALKSQVRALISDREIRHTLKQLEKLGSEVCYIAVNITDEQALQPIRDQWGPIHGIIHGAGVLADKRIKDKQDNSFNQVFSTKVKGFQTMLNVTKADALKHVMIFSSVAAREGNIGQCDYAMANEVLNKMAQQLKYTQDITEPTC